MRTLLTLAVLGLFLVGADPASAFPDFQWARQYGQNGAFHEGIGVAAAPDGTVAATGGFQGTVDFGGNALSSGSFTDTYLTLHATNGSLLWAKSFGGSGFDQGKSVAIDDAGNVYLGGSFSNGADFGGGAISGGGAFLAKFDASGIHQWSFALGTNDIRGICLDASGNVIATGYFAGTVDLGGGNLTSAGGFDMFVARYDASGAPQWAATGGGAASDLGLAVSVDGSGRIAVTGESTGDADFGGGTLAKSGNKDAFVAVFDQFGSHAWSKRFGAPGGQAIGQSVDMDGGGHVVLGVDALGGIDFGGGELAALGSWDVAIARFDGAGVLQWAQRHGGAGADLQSMVKVTASHSIVLAASYAGSASFGGVPMTAGGGSDLAVVGYSVDGNHQWIRGGGGTSPSHSVNPRALGIAAGRVFITGNFSGVLNLVDGYLDTTPNSGTDAYLAGWTVETGTTEPGVLVAVTPTDSGTGTTPVDLTFDSVLSAGGTTLNISTSGPALPGTFTVSGSPRYFDISTTATYEGSIELCVDYDESSLPGPESEAELLHYDSDLVPPAWVSITTTRDTINNRIYGQSTSLSPFVVAAPANATAAPGRIIPGWRGALGQNIPNPFNPTTQILFDLERKSAVKLSLFDVRGARVRVLADRQMPGGPGQSIRWDGLDADGQPVASGVYSCRLQVDGVVVDRRTLTLVR